MANKLKRTDADIKEAVGLVHIHIQGAAAEEKFGQILQWECSDSEVTNMEGLFSQQREFNDISKWMLAMYSRWSPWIRLTTSQSKIGIFRAAQGLNSCFIVLLNSTSH